MLRIRSLLVIGIVLISFPQVVFASKTYVAHKSESLQSIASKYHVAVDELKTVNNLSGSRIAKGTRLIIPSNNDNRSVKLSGYKVLKGDTLPKIAQKTGVKTAELRRINGIKGNKVKVGTVLALSGSSRTTTHANTSKQPVSKELLNNDELTSTLAELSDIPADQPVDLAKTLEENSPQSVSNLKKTAYSFLGARYRFGGNSRNALDCSSFTQQVFREQNIKLPRTAREQFHVGNEVPYGDLKKGDLVFFQTYARFPSHVGIYLGDSKMIHASSRDRHVTISSMDTPYYRSRYLGARRITPANNQHPAIDFNELLQGVDEERDVDAERNDNLGSKASI